MNQTIDRPQVDPQGIIRHAHVQGPVSKNGYKYAMPALKEATPLFEGAIVHIDHDDESRPTRVGESFGVLRRPRFESDGIYADLHFLTTHKLAEVICEDIERRTGMFALSSVNASCRQSGDTVTYFRPRRVDVVTKAATTRPLSDALLEQYVDIEQFEAMRHRLDGIEGQVALFEQFAPQTLQQTISEMTAGYDLSRLHPKVPQTEAQFLRNHFAPAIDNASQSSLRILFEAS